MDQGLILGRMGILPLDLMCGIMESHNTLIIEVSRIVAILLWDLMLDHNLGITGIHRV